MKHVTYKALHLFSGIVGGGALGFQAATDEYRGLTGSFETVAAVDCDPEACQDFKNITGEEATLMDLFSRKDYIAWHGKEPPAEWEEVMPKDILDACKGISPDVVFTSPPCKGFSGLLPEKSAKSHKYKALNNLTIRGIYLTLEAFKDDLPGIFLLENVPRIKSRGAKELSFISRMLESYGYVVSYADHDCGEIGGLGQIRKRFLLIARTPQKVTAFVYKPPKQKLKSIGDIIGPLPMPDNEVGGPMHRLPRLQWKTWVRLALIPAGGDWRDLEKLDWEKYRLTHNPRPGVYGVSGWDKPGKTVIGNARVQGSNGMAAINDPRINCKSRPNLLGISNWEKPSYTVTGSASVSSSDGVAAISDPRFGFKEGTHRAIYWVVHFDKVGPTVTGAHRPNNGSICIADPRLNCSPRSGSYGIQAWDEPGKTVTGAGDIHAGNAGIADPRIPKDTESGTWIIISEDGTWHRPLTTYELAMLQSFPAYMPDGRPFQLVGKSDARWRERIGNAVPPMAAEAIAKVMLAALLPSETKEWVLGFTPVWVMPEQQENYVQ